MKKGPPLPPLTDEQLDLFNRNTRIAYYMANRMWSLAFVRAAFAEREDAIQAALMVLWIAARKFDPQRGKFSAYACNSIRNQLMQCSGQMIRLPINVLFDLGRIAAGRESYYGTKEATLEAATRAQAIKGLEFDGGDRKEPQRGVASDVIDPADDAAQRELADNVSAILAKMPRRERLVLTHLYGTNGAALLTRGHLADMLGVSLSRITQLHKKGRERFAIYAQAAGERLAVSA